MTTLAKFMIIVGADNRPPMLEKSLYDSWKSQDGTTRTKRYEELSVAEKLQADCDLKATNILLQGLPSDVYAIGGGCVLRFLVKVVREEIRGVYTWGDVTRLMDDGIEKEGCLPSDVYAIVNHHKVAKEIWDRVKLLMQGTKLSLQEKECKLYDAFDKFSFVKGETLYQYYWRFAQLINNMNVINMSMRPV
ncbi:hypothetical protein Tco_1045816 [Tanacetum coccineum]|uniref:Uncharacterized protein n=1 Tax=Tanacetum coccineum TaxID=301880 RepID=A0ABQ5GV08_9ASTR